MQGPVLIPGLTEGGGEVEPLSPRLTLQQIDSTQKERRKEILESILIDSNSNEVFIEKNEGDNKLTLRVKGTGDLEVPYMLTVNAASPSYNEIYQVYLSASGEYLQREHISGITSQIKARINNQGINVAPVPEGFSKIDIGAGKLDDILLKFW